MIQLHPRPQIDESCPGCGAPLMPAGWCIPGMRTLARLRCDPCNADYYGDLPSGAGLYYPMLMCAETAEVYDRFGVAWFAEWLRRSYAERRERSAADWPILIETRRALRRPLVLNCLDRLYGHALLKLLNAQHHIEANPGHDLLVLVPRALHWLVPQGVAEVWCVDVSLRECGRWSDSLDRRLHGRLAEFPHAFLSVALSHPHPQDVDIERFSGVTPFAIDAWPEPLHRPVITFVHRPDRAWQSAAGDVSAIARFAARLRETWPRLDFAIAGIGPRSGAPPQAADLRIAPDELSPESERELCRRYAASHLILGVHGSNMLLPSAHAGAAISLTPLDRWRNVMQDMLPRCADARETAFRFRALPAGISADELASVTASVLLELPAFRRRMSPPWARHGGSPATRRDPAPSSAVEVL